MPLEVLFIILSVHGKNDFVEISKILTRYKSENNFVWKIIYQNNYVRRLNWLLECYVFFSYM